MSTIETSKILIDSSASKLAFRAGQALERLLVDRAIAATRDAGATVVTTDHIQSCMDSSLFAQVSSELTDDAHESSARECRKSA